MDVWVPVLKVLSATAAAFVCLGSITVVVMFFSIVIGKAIFVLGAGAIIGVDVYLIHRGWERVRSQPRTLRVLRPDGAPPGERTA